MRPSTQQAQGIADAVLATHRRKLATARTLEHTRLGTHTHHLVVAESIENKTHRGKVMMGQLHGFEVIFVKGRSPFPAKPFTEDISVV